MEEGYFATNDLISTYVPDFSGAAYYLKRETCTGTWSTATGDYSNTWTGALGTFRLESMTVSQLFSLQLGFPYPYGLMNQNLANVFLNPTATTDAYLPLTKDQFINYAFVTSLALGWKAFKLGTQYSAADCCTGSGSQYGKALRDFRWDRQWGVTDTLNGYQQDWLTSVIACLRSGAVPAFFYPGQVELNEYNIYGNTTMYSNLTFTVLAAVCSGAIRKRQAGNTPYYNIVDYINAKITGPMNVSWFGFGYEAQPASAVFTDLTFRRNATQANPIAWGYTGCAPTYTGALVNTLQWARAWPTDISSSWVATDINPGFKDPVGCDFAGGLGMKFGDFKKCLSVLFNKGIYVDPTTGVRTRIMSYTSASYIFNNATAGLVSNQYAYLPVDRASANLRFVAGFFYRIDDSNSEVGAITNSSASNIASIGYPYSVGWTTLSGASGMAWGYDPNSGMYFWTGPQTVGGLSASGNPGTVSTFTAPILRALALSS